MPSWNVHTAHVERLLREHSPDELGIRDVNAFLFGNYVPDVYVGYMVKDISHKIDYQETHFVDPGFVPEPAFWRFWRDFALPSADARGRVSDVTLGAWAHLVADNGYNHCVNEFLLARAAKFSTQIRIMKQSDFELFGRTRDIRMVCQPTDVLLDQAQAFPQYPVEPADARAAILVAQGIVHANQRDHLSQMPSYSLLSEGLFDQMSEVVNQRLARGLMAYARQGVGAPELVEEVRHA